MWSTVSYVTEPGTGLRALEASRKVTSAIEIVSTHSDRIAWTYPVSYCFWDLVYSFPQVWNIFPLFGTGPNPTHSSKSPSNFLKKDCTHQSPSPGSFAPSWNTALQTFAPSPGRIHELLKAAQCEALGVRTQSFSTCWLCKHGYVTELLWGSVSSSAKWDWEHPFKRAFLWGSNEIMYAKHLGRKTWCY